MNDIVEIAYRYAAGIDLRDWSAYRAVFAEEVDLDFSSYRGRPTRVAADDWVAEARRTFDGLDGTQHLMANPMVALDGEEAALQLYVQATHVLDDRSFVIHGYYRDRLVRSADGWRLAAVQLNVLSTTGDESIMGDARRRVAS